MHNCKSIRSSFVELAGDEIPPARSMQLLVELSDCASCRTEYEAVRNTLHVSGQALSGLPTETFWPGYHERLRSRLAQQQAQIGNSSDLFSSRETPRTKPGSRVWSAIRNIATSSVRVPVPAALALMLLGGISFFVLRSRAQVSTAVSIPLVSVEIRSVPVPVIQEKLVTRVVYVDRNRRLRGAAVHADRLARPSTANSLARALTNAPGERSLRLTDFQPTDHVKLTITRGSDKDEK